MHEPNADARIGRLEQQLRVQRRALVAVSLFASVALLAGFAQSETRVIRTRGIVIVDDKGRERILIGAPIPAARNRVRTDLKRAERTWANNFPDPKQYMRWYADYRHTMHGMLVLDENGQDRLAIGDSTPDPNIGKRIGAATGIQINDARGFERSGYGMLTVAGKDRVGLGLDDNQGEAVLLALREDGHAGLSVRGADRRSMFLGISGRAGEGGKDTVAGLVLRKGDRDAHRLLVDDAGPPK